MRDGSPNLRILVMATKASDPERRCCHEMAVASVFSSATERHCSTAVGL